MDCHEQRALALGRPLKINNNANDGTQESLNAQFSIQYARARPFRRG